MAALVTNRVHPNPPYKILEQYHSQPRQMRVVCVGAGAGGLLVAYKLKKDFDNYEFVCYEKNAEVAGTWFENRYPGCACDIPAHVYTYSFEPNPNWSSFYAFAPEIKKYFQDFAVKYDLMPYIQLNSKVTEAAWDEEKGIYNVKINQGGQVKSDWCHMLINGTGCLNDWKWPEIPGLHDFQGPLLHSAAWDASVDTTGKVVGLIGTGSSAIQILPQIQKTAKHVHSFMRSNTWISSPALQEFRELTRDKSSAESAEPKDRKVSQHDFSEAEKRRFREDPEFFLNYRKEIESAMNGGFDLFIKDSEASIAAQKQLQDEMVRRMGPGHEDLKARMIPSWPPGCRRLTPGDGYLESLVQPNVTPIFSEIAKVVPEGIIDEEGNLHKLDILICATGFNLAFAPRFDLRGENGVTMRDEWKLEPQCYLALAAPKFPNYFIINGPRGNWGLGSALNSHEVQVEYMLQFLKRMQEEQIKSVTVKKEIIADLYEHIEEWHHRTVWDADCKSWYKNNIIGGKIWLWGGSNLHYIKTIREPKYEHFDFKYLHRNQFAYLGNGFAEAEVKKQKDMLAPYVRNSDIAWTI